MTVLTPFSCGGMEASGWMDMAEVWVKQEWEDLKEKAADEWENKKNELGGSCKKILEGNGSQVTTDDVMKDINKHLNDIGVGLQAHLNSGNEVLAGPNGSGWLGEGDSMFNTPGITGGSQFEDLAINLVIPKVADKAAGLIQDSLNGLLGLDGDDGGSILCGFPGLTEEGNLVVQVGAVYSVTSCTTSDIAGTQETVSHELFIGEELTIGLGLREDANLGDQQDRQHKAEYRMKFLSNSLGSSKAQTNFEIRLAAAQNEAMEKTETSFFVGGSISF